MGSDQDLTISLGDAVNLSRLEGQSKGYGVKTVIGQETNDAVKDTFATLQLDMLAVKRKKEAVSIFVYWWSKFKIVLISKILKKLIKMY